MTPGSVAGRNPATVTILGKNLEWPQAIYLSSKKITDFTPVDTTKIKFTLPKMFELGKYRLSVETPGGRTGTLPFEVKGTHPSEIYATPAILRAFPFLYKVYTDRNWYAFFMVSPEKKPSTIPGVINMGIGNNFSTLVHFFTIQADSRGYGETKFTIPPAAPHDIRVYFQAITMDPGNITFPVEVSNIVESKIL